ncbi:MAG: hypothetical protein AB1896_15625 [Thermodesulfobacteriota bacterium]
MKITIKLGGPLRKKIEGHQGGELVLELPENARVSDAITALGLGPGDIRVLMKNGLAIHQDETLKDNDRLGLFPRELAYNTITAISFFNPLARKE